MEFSNWNRLVLRVLLLLPVLIEPPVPIFGGQIDPIQMGLRLWNLLEEIHRVVWKNIPMMQLVLRGLSVLPATAIDAAVALDLHSRFGSSCRNWKINPDAYSIYIGDLSRIAWKKSPLF